MGASTPTRPAEGLAFTYGGFPSFMAIRGHREAFLWEDCDKLGERRTKTGGKQERKKCKREAGAEGREENSLVRNGMCVGNFV